MTPIFVTSLVWFRTNMMNLMNFTLQLFNNVHKLYLGIYTDHTHTVAGPMTFKSRKTGKSFDARVGHTESWQLTY